MKCSWFTCEKEAIWYYRRSQRLFCTEHITLNQGMFFDPLVPSGHIEREGSSLNLYEAEYYAEGGNVFKTVQALTLSEALFLLKDVMPPQGVLQSVTEQKPLQSQRQVVWTWQAD